MCAAHCELWISAILNGAVFAPPHVLVLSAQGFVIEPSRIVEVSASCEHREISRSHPPCPRLTCAHLRRPPPPMIPTARPHLPLIQRVQGRTAAQILREPPKRPSYGENSRSLPCGPKARRSHPPNPALRLRAPSCPVLQVLQGSRGPPLSWKAARALS